MLQSFRIFLLHKPYLATVMESILFYFIFHKWNHLPFIIQIFNGSFRTPVKSLHPLSREKEVEGIMNLERLIEKFLKSYFEGNFKCYSKVICYILKANWMNAN